MTLLDLTVMPSELCCYAMPNLRAPLQPFITTRPRELVTIVLVELADETGTTRIDVQRITRVVDSRECDNALTLNIFDHSFRTVVQHRGEECNR